VRWRVPASTQLESPSSRTAPELNLMGGCRTSVRWMQRLPYDRS
jgi:hypothetical protein